MRRPLGDPLADSRRPEGDVHLRAAVGCADLDSRCTRLPMSGRTSGEMAGCSGSLSTPIRGLREEGLRPRPQTIGAPLAEPTHAQTNAALTTSSKAGRGSVWIVPGNPVKQETLEAGGNRGGSGRWVARTQSGQRNHNHRLQCFAPPRQILPKRRVVTALHEENQPGSGGGGIEASHVIEKPAERVDELFGRSRHKSGAGL